MKHKSSNARGFTLAGVLTLLLFGCDDAAKITNPTDYAAADEISIQAITREGKGNQQQLKPLSNFVGSISKGEWHYYSYPASGYAQRTLFTLADLEENLDLYVAQGKPVSGSSYECLSDRPATHDESCEVTSEIATQINVAIYAHQTSGYRLNVLESHGNTHDANASFANARVAPPKGSQNWALSRPAEQSSDQNKFGLASKAVDGNTDGVWKNRSLTLTQREANAWWQVDLGQSRLIQQIQLHNRTDCCSSRLRRFYVFVSDKNMSQMLVQDLLADPDVLSFYQNSSVATDVDFATDTNGRYVKIQLSGNGYLSLAEVQVYGKESTGPSVKEKQIDAARFLAQAGFGGTLEEIGLLAQNNDYENWLIQQYNMPRSLTKPYADAVFAASVPVAEYTRAQVPYTEPSVPFATAKSSKGRAMGYNFSTAWMRNIVSAEDHMRQRATWALSQLLVTSMVGDDLFEQWGSQLMSLYYDTLSKHALGNYRDLLVDVSNSPVMAKYLTYLGNDKANPANNLYPDENYARELMQLFTIGLWELEPNGLARLDSQSQRIPTYDNRTIEALARVFTGYWIKGRLWKKGSLKGNTGVSHLLAGLEMNQEHHDQKSKTLFPGTAYSTTLAANQDGLKDVSDAIDVLFNHPNTGPFLAKSLIPFYTTSNPSPNYVERVADVFDDNGQGVRGDLFAVFSAILLDPEARDLTALEDTSAGKLQSPMLRLARMVHAYHAGDNISDESVNGLQFWVDIDGSDFLQWPMRSPSVFNFFSPDYQNQGEIQSAGLTSPEFQIMTPISSIATVNLLESMIENAIHHHPEDGGNNGSLFRFDLAILVAQGTNERILDHLDLTLTNRTLSDNSRSLIKQRMRSIDSITERARFAMWAVATSADAAILR